MSNKEKFNSKENLSPKEQSEKEESVEQVANNIREKVKNHVKEIKNEGLSDKEKEEATCEEMSEYLRINNEIDDLVWKVRQEEKGAKYEYERNNEIDSKQETNLSIEKRKQLKKIWEEMVVDKKSFNNIENLDNNEIKDYLFASIMKEIKEFIKDSKINLDNQLIENIKSADNVDDKSVSELKYIKEAHNQVNKLVEEFSKLKNKSAKWDSWPKRIKENKSFNCVGATLLGIYLLEQAGIESHYGVPSGHVINIAKLSNGVWWYVDFRNGKENVLKLEPEIIEINGVETLKVDRSEIDYNLIPIFDNSIAPGLILNNLSALEYEANDESISNNNLDKKSAKDYLKEYKDNFENIDFNSLSRTIYPELSQINKSDAMKREMRRIREIKNFKNIIRDYISSLTKEQKDFLKKEIKLKRSSIKEFFKDEDNIDLENVSNELRGLLKLFLKNLENINPEFSQKVINKVVEMIGYK